MSGTLIYVPLNPKPPEIYPQTMESLHNLKCPAPTRLMFGRGDDPNLHPYENICNKYNEARQVVLNDGFDALFTVEADMIIPWDALVKLSEVDAWVSYGLYCSRHERDAGNRRQNDRGVKGKGYMWLAFSFADEHASVVWSDHPRWRLREIWGTVQPTAGLGMGCTYIRRAVLESITFRTHPEHKTANDWMFSLDCQAHGYSQATHFGVVCGHMLDEGRAIWPDVEADTLYRIMEV